MADVTEKDKEREKEKAQSIDSQDLERKYPAEIVPPGMTATPLIPPVDPPIGLSRTDVMSQRGFRFLGEVLAQLDEQRLKAAEVVPWDERPAFGPLVGGKLYKILFGDVEATAEEYIGSGPLVVDTVRGEIKAYSGDIIIELLPNEDQIKEFNNSLGYDPDIVQVERIENVDGVERIVRVRSIERLKYQEKSNKMVLPREFFDLMSSGEKLDKELKNREWQVIKEDRDKLRFRNLSQVKNKEEALSRSELSSMPKKPPTTTTTKTPPTPKT
jgi:hypothetical protein